MDIQTIPPLSSTSSFTCFCTQRLILYPSPPTYPPPDHNISSSSRFPQTLIIDVTIVLVLQNYTINLINVPLLHLLPNQLMIISFLHHFILSFNSLVYTWHHQNISGSEGEETYSQPMFCETFQSRFLVIFQLSAEKLVIDWPELLFIVNIDIFVITSTASKDSKKIRCMTKRGPQISWGVRGESRYKTESEEQESFVIGNGLSDLKKS